MQVLANIYQRYLIPANSKPVSKTLNNLPEELLINIFKYLSTYDLAQLGKTCTDFRRLAKDHTLEIAKRTLFLKKAVVSKIAPSNLDWADFLYDKENRRLIQFTGPEMHMSVENINLVDKTKVVVFPNECIFYSQINDYWAFGYFRNSFYIQFVNKKTHRFLEPINITQYVGPHTRKEVYGVSNDMNSLSLRVKDHFVCIKDQRHVFHIPPLEFEDSTFAVPQYSSLFGDSIVVTYIVHHQKQDYYLQNKFSISEKRLIGTRTILLKGDTEALSHVKITKKYIVTIMGLYDKTNPHISVNVCDMDFKHIKNYTINIAPKIYFPGQERTTYGDFPVFYAYENRLVVLINLNHLLFIELCTGRIIKEQDIGVVDGEQTNFFRTAQASENFLVTKKGVAELYDVYTGNLLRKFKMPGITKWLEFTEPYHVLFNYKTNKNNEYYAHLHIAKKIKKAPRKTTTRKKITRR